MTESQFRHVAQFLETTFTFSIPVLLAAQILNFVNQLWTKNIQTEDDQFLQYQKWKENQIKRRIENDQQKTTADQNPDSAVRNVQEELNPNHHQQLIQEQKIKEHLTVEKSEDHTNISPPWFKFYRESNRIFYQYVPIIMCISILGILTWSTYIVTMASFFLYLFSSLLFNYVRLFQKLTIKVENQSIPRFVSLLSGCFVVMFFIAIFVKSQFSGL